jgi:acetyl esterase/lipase
VILSLLILIIFYSAFGRLDLYLPANAKDRTPVVAFITGGAWIIG